MAKYLLHNNRHPLCLVNIVELKDLSPSPIKDGEKKEMNGKATKEQLIKKDSS